MADLNMSVILAQMFPPKPSWSSKNIPDLTGKVCIVTGGNTGIGKETCKHLLTHGAKVYLAARSKPKAEAAIEDLFKETGKRAVFLELDLSDLAAVKKGAETYKQIETKLDVLFNNAGVMTPPIEQITAQKHDMQFGVNTLASFLLIHHLWPILTSTGTSDAPSRVVWTCSSVNYYFKAPINYDTLKDGPARKKLGPFQLYCQSKFAAIMLAYQFAKKAQDEGGRVVVTAVDPGNIRSDLQRHSGFVERNVLHRILLHPLPLGAITQLYAGTSPEAAAYNGKYLRPWARLGEPHKDTKNEGEQKKMWDYCTAEVNTFL